MNLKGGVGKTAIAVNFAAYCGNHGMRTLLVDLDPQTNATLSCIDIAEWKSHARDKGTVADLLHVRRHTSAEGVRPEVTSVIRPEVFQNVDLIPSHLDLFMIDLDLAAAVGRERKLSKALSPILNNYQIVVCDCPPNLAITTQNALALSTHYVVPISPDYLSAIGVALLITRVQELSEDLERNLKHVGIVMSRVGRPAQHREQITAALRKQFQDLVFKQEIKERVAVSQAAAAQKPVYEMRVRAATEEFEAVSAELIRRLGVEP